MNDCWNAIGIRGDGSCPELKQYVHCRNCPVYAAAATELLRKPAPDGYAGEWTNHLAQPKQLAASRSDSAVIFRVGAEWLALPTAVVKEVANLKPLHSLPHRRGGVVLGVTNVRGELLVCASLGAVLGLVTTESKKSAGSTAYKRMLVIRREEVRAVCPVDEVHGVERFHARDLKDVPATLAKATTRYSRKLLTWRDRSVGLIDDQLLFHTLRRSLA